MLDGIELGRRNFAQAAQGSIELIALGGDALDELPKIVTIDPLRLGVLRILPMSVLPRSGIELHLIKSLQREAPRKTAGAVAHAYASRRRSRFAISIAANAASAPLLPAFPPARSTACSMVSVVSTPNAIGTPDTSAMRARPEAHSPAT